MNESYGRHRGATAHDRAGNIAAGIITVAALCGAGVVAKESTGSSSSGPAAGGVSEAPVRPGPAATACDDAVILHTHRDLVPALTRVTESYREAQHSSCSPVVLKAADSPRELATQVSKTAPAEWIARSVSDIEALPATIERGTPSTIASTPVVLALPAPLADAWGWPTTPLTTDAWRAWLLGHQTWASTGHPQWGSFSIRMADPRTNPTAAIGFGGLLSLANGGPLTAAPDYGKPDDQDLAVIKVEHHVSSVVDDQASVLPARTATLAQVTATASAYLTTEQAVAAHNANGPTTPLSAVPVAGGAASVPLEAVRVGTLDPGKPGAATADSFHGYLTSPAGLAALRAAGLRAPDGAAPTDSPAGVSYASAPVKPVPVSGQTIRAAVQTWQLMHTRISSMALIDASGSMNQPFVGHPLTRIDLVRSLVEQTYRTASPRARSGVWFFHTAGVSGTPLIERATTLDVNTATTDGKNHSQRVAEALKDVTIQGGTPLYQAVREAYAYTLSAYDPSYVNQLVVLSDGANRDTTSPDQLGDLLRYLDEVKDPARPVRIICLGYGAEADMGALQAIAAATGGRAARVSSPEEMPAVVDLALFSL